MSSAIIIGGGPGGLFTAAILAREGIEVTVLEKNRNIGGGLQSFSRFGNTYDTGMHAVGGLSKGGNVKAICNWLGIGDRLPVMDTDHEVADRIRIMEDGAAYEMAAGRDSFTERLVSYFPQEESGIRAYVDAIYRMAGEVDVYNLRENPYSTLEMGEDFLLSADTLISKYVTDPKLRALLAWLNSYYSGVKGVTPAYTHSLLQVLYINGAQRFVGGSVRFADLLCEVVKSNGGKIITGSPVASIETEDRRIISVTLGNGSRYTADRYVSAIDPSVLISLFDRPEVFPKSYRNRISEIPMTYSAFSLFLKFKPETFPYLNRSGFIYRSYGSVWQFSEDDSWPQGILYSTLPESVADRWATKMTVTSPMLWSSVSRWEKTGRDAAYREWKNECCEKLLTMLEAEFPDIRSKIEAVNTASPLTIRDYYMTRNGSMSGFLRDCSHIERTVLPVKTKLENLFLTGQNNNLHGFCGVALTAMLTCEAVLECGDLVERISKCKD